MALNRKKPSLAEKISNFVTAAPTIFGSDDENEETKARVVDYEGSDTNEDVPGSTFRKQNVDLLNEIDDRYKGKKVSRKDIYEMDDDDDNENEDSEDIGSNYSEDTSNEGENSEKDIESNKDASSESTSDMDEDSEIDEDNPLRRNRNRETNFQHILPTNVQVNIDKGNCVREQLRLWENLLEMRIKLQKCLKAGNQLPQNDSFQKYNNESFKKEMNNGRNQLSALLDNLLEMQKQLLDNYPETKNLQSQGENRNAEKSNMDEEICSDTEDEMDTDEESNKSSIKEKEKDLPRKKKKRTTLQEYEKILAARHGQYHEYRDSIIQKWNDKTRVASGNVNKGTSQAILKQIEFVLRDKTKLLKKTQLKRSEYQIIGKELSTNEDDRRMQEYDSDIYDDDDFYHQLLRELIEYKSANVTDPVQLSKQWISLQNMRKKMKRKIDTRATKGRRIRYNVHAKLVNFMAPVNVDDTWSVLAKNELYNSLFGKIKPAEVSATNEQSANS